MQERDPHQWCFVSGKVSALETTLLRGDFLQKFLYLEGREDLLSCIKDSPLRDCFRGADDLSVFEDIINGRYLTLVHEIRRVSPSAAVCDFFLRHYDFMNLKNLLKESIYGLPLAKRFPSAVGDDVWRRLWEGDRKPSLPEVYGEAVNALKSHMKDDAARAGGPGLVDNVLDGYLLHCLSTLAAELKSELIREYVRDYLRLKGILMFQRVPAGRETTVLWFLKEDEFFGRFLPGPPPHWRDALLEIVPERVVEKIVTGDKEGLLSRYEKHTGDYLTDKLEPALYATFGPERVFGYLAGLTTELFNLRLLIGGKVNKLNPQIIKDALRRAYV